MERVITYIDGFNLYYGLKSKNFRRYYWLNLQALAKNLLKPHQKLMACKYFTARISGPPAKAKRQTTYIEALETLGMVEIFYGKYFVKPIICNKCKYTNYIPEEKMTDVNIATEMIVDAFRSSYDTAMLISADSDLSHSVSSISKLFPEKRIVVCFPPGRSSFALSNACSGRSFVIGRRTLAKSVLTDIVTKDNAVQLKRPENWK
ncbi:MAG: NYN domain-containing protein [candidate division Zixibacteria bacterium]|nr:NYN domain-containing protein [candidate division Zixibacteria bacterium]